MLKDVQEEKGACSLACLRDLPQHFGRWKSNLAGMATATTIVNTALLVFCFSIPRYAIACRFAELTSGQTSHGEPSSSRIQCIE